MSQLAAIKDTQDKLEETFTKRMAELEAQLHTGASAKDTVARVAEEFRAFRELTVNMLKLLRQQITDCSNMLDVMETRHRRNALIFLGASESDGEDCAAVVQQALSKMALKEVHSAIRVCHRIGSKSVEGCRPMLVWFDTTETRAMVWRSKSKLKGSPVSVKEFLTKPRQAVFARARQHFGIRSCWSQDGTIIVKISDGCRRKITTIEELNALMTKHPKPTVCSSSTAKSGSNNPGASGSNNKPRKIQ